VHSVIERIAQRIMELSGEGSVSGASDQDVEELLSLWGVPRLPSAYVYFLKSMGRKAGRLLEGTDAFFPRIKQMPSFIADFLPENEGSWRPPEESLIFAMHQGYQVYYMEDVALNDPPIALYMEGDPKPMRRWGSLTSFLDSQLAEDYGRFAD